MQQHGSTQEELRELTLAVTALAVRVLLSANGFNVVKAIDQVDAGPLGRRARPEGAAGPAGDRQDVRRTGDLLSDGTGARGQTINGGVSGR